MPMFLGNISTTVSYGIILLQQACSIPAVFVAGRLVETRFGRKYTTIVSFIIGGLCCFLFYIEPNVISVYDI